MQTVHERMRTFVTTGRLDWIGLRSARRGEVAAVEAADVVAGLGLTGDHRSAARKVDPAAKRQITLIQAEHLPVIAALMGLDQAPAPDLLRRNLVMSGIPVQALKDVRFRIGTVEFAGSGPCHPCSRMDENLGTGALTAMRGHGGITARILTSGTIQVGDPVQAMPDVAEAQG